MGQTPHLNLKPAIKPPVWLPHAHLCEWTSNLKRLSGLLLLFMSLCAEMLSLTGLFLFYFIFFCTSLIWVLRGSALPSVWKSFFMTWEETLTGFLQQSWVYAICTRCCTSSAQNFEFTHWWYTAAPLLLPSSLCYLTASQQTKKCFMDSFETIHKINDHLLPTVYATD